LLENGEEEEEVENKSKDANLFGKENNRRDG